MDLHASRELFHLELAVVIGLIQLIWATVAGSGGARDLRWLMGPRDEPRPVAGVYANRVSRALQNFLDTFPIFAAALVGAILAGKTGNFTFWGSGLYVVGRVLYAPLYALGIPVLRTLAWTVAMVGIVLIVVAYFQ
jgi:uncharacterized MAPEG superfamily protein